MKKFASIFVFLFCCKFQIQAIPAYPRKIAINMNGQTVYIQMYGDEHRKWAETSDGYTIVQDSDCQWQYATLGDDGYLRPSGFLLTKSIDDTTKDFLQKTPRHITPRLSRNKEAETAIQRSKAAVGERKVLIVLMEYQDKAFTKTVEDFDALFNEEGYHADGAQGSVRDFYQSASYGQLDLECDIFGPYTTSKDMSYYGRNAIDGGDTNAYALFEEAIGNVVKDADLHQYDADHDGLIDNMHIIFAGYGEEAGAAADAIWSHESMFYRPMQVGDMKIDRYSCAPELRGNKGNGISRIGPHCHEIGHALGAMDFYDTNYATGGEYSGTGMWDVMASGSWNNDGITPADFNPYVKINNYGWVTPRVMPKGSVSVRPSSESPDNYFIFQGNESSETYLIEYRNKTKWGAGLPGEGLLIFHTHQDLEKAGNDINSTAPQMCYAVCASSRFSKPGEQPITYGEINSSGCPFPGHSNNTAFTSASTPSAFWWSGIPCSIDLIDITLNNNGSISLVNNSTGSFEEPEETCLLFFESFEDDLKLFSADSTWQVVQTPDNPFSVKQRPSAFEGNRFLMLSAENQYLENVTGSFEFCCDSIMSSGEVTVKGHVISTGTKGRVNSLRIGYQLFENDEEWLWEDVESVTDGLWKQFIVKLPGGVSPFFIIQGSAGPLSILALDNIEVEQVVVKESNDISGIKSDSNTHRKAIYSLQGIHLNSQHKGIYLNTHSGHYVKKIVK